MKSDDATSPAPTENEVESFFAGALGRILKLILAATAILAAPVWWFFGLAASLGFLAGGVISWLNFKALARGVEGIANRIVDHRSRERGGVVIFRFLLRYVLVAGVAYGIFRGSTKAFHGFLFGVCVPVPAMLSEAAYEGFCAFRRGY